MKMKISLLEIVLLIFGMRINIYIHFLLFFKFSNFLLKNLEYYYISNTMQ